MKKFHMTLLQKFLQTLKALETEIIKGMIELEEMLK